MNPIYLLLGSNLGNSAQYLQEARKSIESDLGPILKTSSIYQTAAWGKTDQPDFLNQVILISSNLNPKELLSKILAIETKLGRSRIDKWNARTMDIDILFYGEYCINESDLIVPHPYLHLRSFTLTPLLEIAPDFYHPVLNKTIAVLCENLSDNLFVDKIVSD